MIVVGYQGVGKSTLAKKWVNAIDLESSHFWVDGRRDPQWYIPYCSIADSLSKQGFVVCVSSHEVVRKQLQASEEVKVIVCPSPHLQDEWIAKLQERWDETGLDKDWKALANALDRFADNVGELLNESGFKKVVIMDMDYDLGNLLGTVMRDEDQTDWSEVDHEEIE